MKRSILFALMSMLATCVAVVPASAQDRYTNDAMGWSCVPPEGWSRVEGTTLESIRSDLLQGPGGANIEACWAMGAAGSLPRIVLTITPGEITSIGAAEELVHSFTEGTTLDDPTRLSARSGLASLGGEVIVLTEGMVGAHGLIQLVAYTRADSVAEVEQDLLDMIESAKFETGAKVPDTPAAAPNRLVDWGIRGAVIGAMLAVVIFGVRMLRAMWAPTAS